MTPFIKRVNNACSWRLRRLGFAATHEWLRSPPYVLRHAGFDVLYNPGNALAFRYCLTGQYEPEVEAFLGSELRPGSVVADVGANIGFFTLAAIRASEGARVHAFEPSPASFALLKACIAHNGLGDRVTPNQVALYSESGEMQFHLHAPEYGAYDGFRDTGYTGVGKPTVARVPVTTLDAYAEEVAMDRLHLLKIDVEGAELSVLRGARAVLTNLRPTVLFEVGYQNLRPFGILPVDLHRFFGEIGYQVANLRRRPLSEGEFAVACVADHEFIAVPNAGSGGEVR